MRKTQEDKTKQDLNSSRIPWPLTRHIGVQDKTMTITKKDKTITRPDVFTSSKAPKRQRMCSNWSRTRSSIHINILSMSCPCPWWTIAALKRVRVTARILVLDGREDGVEGLFGSRSRTNMTRSTHHDFNTSIMWLSYDWLPCDSRHALLWWLSCAVIALSCLV